ncbi:hypothetical protein GCM10025864_39190 [Luteimicrobium album]|uniref:Uncharacterized protein n=1 Tax=Luteimicrobium album TaxID=1054550 RepID=A0ABQ6I8U9_9MICO|nr:hypothetical protein [Luteimicrobium album]GMA26160.1 hypothetical protein GCM10025864_39190 [Luteimicrobium album]
MSHHTLTIEFDGYVQTTLNCHAPAESSCHAIFECDCEEFYDFRVEDGVPIHYPAYDTPTTTVDDSLAHRGHFDPDVCNLRDWHENSEEDLIGSVTIPVREDWQGDYYLFDITPKPEGSAS